MLPTSYRKALDEFRLRGSMGRRGNPYGNAKAESFMKTLKRKHVYRYPSFTEVSNAFQSSIDQVCNT